MQTLFSLDTDNRLLLIDGHAILYRAYFAFPNLTTPSGELVNAVFGFTRIMLTAIRDVNPKYIAVVFDHPKPTFRHQEYAEYKAHREKMPDDLQPQIERVKEVVKALNMPQFELEGYEADDLIGTLSGQIGDSAAADSPAAHTKAVIVTGDRDLFQLVNDSVHVWLPGRGKRVDEEYDRDQVKDYMGVYPEQVVDLKALMGDASDNIPGVRGIGPKTAQQLISHYDSLEALYQVVDADSGPEPAKGLTPAVLKKLQEQKDSAFLSQRLATINCAAPITLDLEACQVAGYDKDAVAQLFAELDFRSLIGLLPKDEFESGVQAALF